MVLDCCQFERLHLSPVTVQGVLQLLCGNFNVTISQAVRVGTVNKRWSSMIKEQKFRRVTLLINPVYEVSTTPLYVSSIDHSIHYRVQCINS